MVGHVYNTTAFVLIDHVNLYDQTSLERSVPVGNIMDKEFTLIVTIFVTLSICILFAIKIIKVASKYNF